MTSRRSISVAFAKECKACEKCEGTGLTSDEEHKCRACNGYGLCAELDVMIPPPHPLEYKREYNYTTDEVEQFITDHFEFVNVPEKRDELVGDVVDDVPRDDCVDGGMDVRKLDS